MGNVLIKANYSYIYFCKRLSEQVKRSQIELSIYDQKVKQQALIDAFN